ncbi:hypothetical protein EDC01DRAFT_670512 [Geopyxis carbonaria]|nr:hypothetical protein EDC01DRAFT_670512 [Geopyxis carbonaria]
MSSALNKRQQARNERTLQDLLKSVPGNDRCADCGTRNPGWASWSLGIFLCIRCASLHRKLGTHVSKVKSITMDSWSNDQVENMRKNGNTKSNAHFNPDPAKHPPPLSSEDTDSHLERHIRAKYEYQTFIRDAASSKPSSSSGTGSSGGFGITSNGGSGPPPSSSSSNNSLSVTNGKSSKRSVSAGFTGSRLSFFGRSSSPNNTKMHRSPPPSAGIQFPHGMVTASPMEKYEDQLKNLREMGFVNTKQNVEVLQQTDGKILEAVEILIRLNRTEEKRPDPPPKNDAFGLSAQKTGPAALGQQRTGGSANPFDALDKEGPPLPPLPAQSAQSTGSTPVSMMPIQAQGMNGMSMNGNPGNPWNGVAVNGYNPQQQQPFQMNGMAQALPTQQQLQQQPTNPYALSQQQFSQSQPVLQSQTYNPFMSMAPQQNPLNTGSTWSTINTMNTLSTVSTNPTGMNPYTQQFQQQFPQQPQYTNPYQQQQQQPVPISSPAQQPSYMPQMTRPSKTDILALYSAPQLAPPKPATQVQLSVPQPQQQPVQSAPTTPNVGSNNPFAERRHHASQESVDFGGWQSGRHSPDAFANLAFGGR